MKMKVKDLMVPIEEYATVGYNATLYEALIALKTAQEKLQDGKPPHRAVLVNDAAGNLVGNVGRLSFIKALGVGFSVPTARAQMDRAGVSLESIATVMNHVRFLYRDRGSLQDRAKSIKARNVMHPVGESIDEEGSLQEAIDLFSACQVLSILVKRGTRVVGVLRVSDLFQKLQNQILDPDEDRKED
jgi:CBS domain-containing protein